MIALNRYILIFSITLSLLLVGYALAQKGGGKGCKQGCKDALVLIDSAKKGATTTKDAYLARKTDGTEAKFCSFEKQVKNAIIKGDDLWSMVPTGGKCTQSEKEEEKAYIYKINATLTCTDLPGLFPQEGVKGTAIEQLKNKRKLWKCEGASK